MPKASVDLDYQLAVNPASTRDHGPLPSEAQVRQWIDTTLAELDYSADVQLTVRIVDRDEMAELNQTYRHKQGVTNVLSFPFEQPQGLPEQELVPLLGDIIICAPVVHEEAAQQQKAVLQHWAHMIVHGLLHLLGYDHISDAQAEQMEGLEVRVLAALGIDNPYLSPNT